MIPVNEPLLNGNEKKYLSECIDSGWISSEGPFVTKFENEMALRVGRKHAIAVNNGTAALDAAIAALGISPGDEVIMPTFTIISCVAQIVRQGGVPVLVDSDPITWNMNCADVESKVSARTKAIMVVHIYGLPVDMDPVLNVARKYGIKVIEDAAEMHGQQYRGRPCGSFGEISTFSFYPNKHITCGEGGMILTDDDNLAARCRSLRNLCFQADRRFVHEDLGWNLRMTNMQAAIGFAQLERLEFFVEKKRRMGALYTKLLEDIPGLQLPLPRTDYADNIYWVFGIVIGKGYDFDAADAMSRLASKGVGCRPFFAPMHTQPVLKKLGLFDGESLPVSENMYKKGFYIPSGMALTDEQIHTVADAVVDIFA